MTTVILETLILVTSYPACVVNSNLSHSSFTQLLLLFFLRDREEFPHGKFIAESTCVQCLTSMHPTCTHSFTHLYNVS